MVCPVMGAKLSEQNIGTQTNFVGQESEARSQEPVGSSQQSVISSQWRAFAC